jgi:hypothetical protein
MGYECVGYVKRSVRLHLLCLANWTSGMNCKRGLLQCTTTNLIYMGTGLHSVPGRVHVADHGGCDGSSDLGWPKPYAASSCRANNAYQSDLVLKNEMQILCENSRSCLHCIPLAAHKISSAD